MICPLAPKVEGVRGSLVLVKVPSIVVRTVPKSSDMRKKQAKGNEMPVRPHSAN